MILDPILAAYKIALSTPLAGYELRYRPGKFRVKNNERGARVQREVSLRVGKNSVETRTRNEAHGL